MATVNGIDLCWELSGQTGDPLVLVHGSWADRHVWDPVAPRLARSLRVLTYDRRGHSQSERPGGQGSVRDDVADLAALIEHLDLAPAHILGNSFGGSIVLRLAAARPDLFRSMLIHEPPTFGVLEGDAAQQMLKGAQDAVDAVIRLLERGEAEEGACQFMETIAFGPGAWKRFPDEVRKTFIYNAPTFLDEQRDPEWLLLDTEALEDFSAPALLTRGDQSAPFFRLVVEQLARHLPNAQVEVLVDADHVPQLSQPERYADAVKSFIGGVG